MFRKAIDPMWLFTKYGFFSVVAGYGNKFQVRARVRGHLQNIQFVCPELRIYKIIESDDTDYAYRIIVSRENWLLMLEKLGNWVDYPNFKDECHLNERLLGVEYVNALLGVWRSMAFVQDITRERVTATKKIAKIVKKALPVKKSKKSRK